MINLKGVVKFDGSGNRFSAVVLLQQFRTDESESEKLRT